MREIAAVVAFIMLVGSLISRMIKEERQAAGRPNQFRSPEAKPTEKKARSRSQSAAN